MESMHDLVGQTLGEYEIVEQIGQGGMATVFKARQAGLNRDVALKVLPPYIAQKEGFAERFNREAQAIGNLHHPNILPVYASGQDKGYGYIAMRYIPNASTLTDLMKNPLQPEQITHLTRQIAAALDHAHQAGIVHRDIKPSNILMDANWVLLSDFGLAKMMATPSELTGTGVGLGTPAYMSPEQAKAERVDRRTDIYSLGIILFEMLTGQVPHKAETPLATVLKRINDPLPPPRSFNPGIPPSVEKVLLQALATNPAQRYDSAGELAGALETAFSEPVAATVITKSVAGDHPRDPAAQPVGTDLPEQSRPGSRASMEIAVMTLLGIVSVCGIGGALLALIPSSETGQASLEMAPACLAMTFAGLTSVGMVWQRNRNKSPSAWLALGILAWFIGVNILGWGVFAALTPGDNTIAENLGFSLALCFAPGAFLALLGLALYIYDYRKAPVIVNGVQMVSSNMPRNYNDRLHRASEYRVHISNLIKQQKKSAFAGELSPIEDKLKQWEAHLRQLVNRLNAFERDQIIQRDLREVPAAIEKLQTQLASETDPQIAAEIKETLASRQAHQRHLDTLVTLMRRTELDIDETIAAIGAIYSQLQIIGARDIDGSRAKRLSSDVEEQASRLSDLLSAMDDVYDSSRIG